MGPTPFASRSTGDNEQSGPLRDPLCSWRRVWDSSPPPLHTPLRGARSLRRRGPTQGFEPAAPENRKRRRPPGDASSDGGGCGIRTHGTLLPTGFQDQVHRPLGQPSRRRRTRHPSNGVHSIRPPRRGSSRRVRARAGWPRHHPRGRMSSPRPPHREPPADPAPSRSRDPRSRAPTRTCPGRCGRHR